MIRAIWQKLKKLFEPPLKTQHEVIKDKVRHGEPISLEEAHYLFPEKQILPIQLAQAPVARFQNMGATLREQSELERLDELFPMQTISDMHKWTNSDIQVVLDYLSMTLGAKLLSRGTQSNIPPNTKLSLLIGSQVVDLVFMASGHASNTMVECGWVECHITDKAATKHYFIGFATAYTSFVFENKSYQPSAPAVANQILKFLDDATTKDGLYRDNVRSIAEYDGKIYHITCNQDPLIEKRCMAPAGQEYKI